MLNLKRDQCLSNHIESNEGGVHMCVFVRTLRMESELIRACSFQCFLIFYHISIHLQTFSSKMNGAGLIYVSVKSINIPEILTDSCHKKVQELSSSWNHKKLLSTTASSGVDLLKVLNQELEIKFLFFLFLYLFLLLVPVLRFLGFDSICCFHYYLHYLL